MNACALNRLACPAAVSVCLLACQPAPRDEASSRRTPDSASASVPQADTGRQQRLAWLQCVECSGGELDRVVALGRSSDSSATVETLGQDLRGGPSPAYRANIRQQFDSAYTEDSLDAVEDGDQPVLTRAQYVQPLLDNFVNTYRVRAARALARIGGPAAKVALDSALFARPLTPGDTLRASARLRIRQARERAVR